MEARRKGISHSGEMKDPDKRIIARQERNKWIWEIRSKSVACGGKTERANTNGRVNTATYVQDSSTQGVDGDGS